MPSMCRQWRERHAGNASADIVSRRYASPALRCGPAGDTTATLARRLTMAESKLPALAGPAHEEH